MGNIKAGFKVQGKQGQTLPTVTTADVTAIGTTTATSGGNVTNSGQTAVTARGVCWSSAPNPTTGNSKTVNGGGTGGFVSSLTGLTPNALYYVRAYATNNQGTAYGNQVTFTAQAEQQVSSERLYTTHLMYNYVTNVEDLQGWVQSEKDLGTNVIWAFKDHYDYNDLMLILNAAHAKGMKVIPSNQSNEETARSVAMIKDSWNHPAVYRTAAGKRVYIGYHYHGELPAIKAGLTAQGIDVNGFEYWVYAAQYPVTIAGYTYYFATPQKVQDIVDYYNNNPGVTGLINFAVDKPNGISALQNIKDENKFLVPGSRTVPGRTAIGGINHTYASSQFTVFFFEGTLSILLDMLAKPVSEWTDGMSEATADDQAERSMMSKPLNAPVNGLSFLPKINVAFYFGGDAMRPIVDNSGIKKFINPWMRKFINSDKSPVVITQDRIFCWYQLHPRNAPFIDIVPAYFAQNGAPAVYYPDTPSALTLQQWWQTTFYHGHQARTNGSYTFAGREQKHWDSKVQEIKAHMPADFTHVKMACHLTTPAVLRITIAGVNHDSPLRAAGAAYWEIPQPTVLPVTPVFSIVRNGVVVKTGTGKQPITSQCWPGGWQPLVDEV